MTTRSITHLFCVKLLRVTLSAGLGYVENNELLFTWIQRFSVPEKELGESQCLSAFLTCLLRAFHSRVPELAQSQFCNPSPVSLLEFQSPSTFAPHEALPLSCTSATSTSVLQVESP